MKATVVTSTAISTSDPVQPLIQSFSRNQSCVNTKENYKREIRLFFHEMGVPATDVTLHDLIEYKEHLEQRSYKPSTIAKKITVLKSLFGFLYLQGALPTNPSAGLKTPRVKNEGVKDILSLAEGNKLLASIDTSTIEGKRNLAVICLLYINSLRVSEVAKANVSDLSYKEDCWALRVQGKGGKICDVRLREDVKQVLDAYLKARGDVQPNDALFIGCNHRSKSRISIRTVQRIVDKHLQAINITRSEITAHALRRSGISHVVEAGCDIFRVSRYARHESVSTTHNCYVRVKDALRNSAVMSHPARLQ